jgi:hypothetical protein
MSDAPRRLTVRRLNAIKFALEFVLAGDVDATLEVFSDEPTKDRVTSDDLDAASEWASEQIRVRGSR